MVSNINAHQYHIRTNTHRRKHVRSFHGKCRSNQNPTFYDIGFRLKSRVYSTRKLLAGFFAQKLFLDTHEPIKRVDVLLRWLLETFTRLGDSAQTLGSFLLCVWRKRHSVVENPKNGIGFDAIVIKVAQRIREHACFPFLCVSQCDSVVGFDGMQACHVGSKISFVCALGNADGR